MKYLLAVVYTALVLWFALSWAEVVHKHDHHEHEYSQYNLLVMLFEEKEA